MKLRTIFKALALAVFAVALWQAGGSTGPVSAAPHSGDLHNCSDYSSQALAQAHLNENPSDPDNLDTDDDGLACEEYFGGASCYYAGCGTNYIPLGGVAYTLASTPSHLSLLVSPTAVPCNGQASVTVRVFLPDGSGAPHHIVQFNSTTGTVFTNLVTDAAGYVTTTFTAPFTAGPVQITASAGSLNRSQSVNVECARHEVVKPVLPVVRPPSTGDGGLVAASEGTSYAYLAGALLLVTSMAAGRLVVARQRSR